MFQKKNVSRKKLFSAFSPKGNWQNSATALQVWDIISRYGTTLFPYHQRMSQRNVSHQELYHKYPFQCGRVLFWFSWFTLFVPTVLNFRQSQIWRKSHVEQLPLLGPKVILPVVMWWGHVLTFPSMRTRPGGYKTPRPHPDLLMVGQVWNNLCHESAF